MSSAPLQLPAHLAEQIRKAGLPVTGTVPFVPKLSKNRAGDDIIEKAEVTSGPKKGKKGWVDVQDRIWVRDRAHADVADHWDVQTNRGRSYIRVDDNGNEI